MTPNPTHTPGAAPAAPMRPGAGEATSGAQLFDQAMLQNVLQGLAREGEFSSRLRPFFLLLAKSHALTTTKRAHRHLSLAI